MKLAIPFAAFALAGCAISTANLNPYLVCRVSDGKAIVLQSNQGLTPTVGAGVGALLPDADRLCAPVAPVLPAASGVGK